MKSVTEVFAKNSNSDNLETLIVFLENCGFNNVEKLDLYQCAILFNNVRNVLDDTITGERDFEKILFED